MSQLFLEKLDKAKSGVVLNHDDIKVLLNADAKEKEQLFCFANEVRQKNVGDAVHLRGIIEFSNYCRQHCQYCGLRADNQKITRYRLSKEQILETAAAAVSAGYKTLVLQGGEDIYFRPEDIAEITSEVKKLGVAITLSFGEYEKSVYALWRDAGADRYLIKQETADSALYAKIRPGKQLKDRLRCQQDLKDLGYQLGSGSMIGLPGQTLDTLASDLELMRQMDVEMSGMGPFIPHPDTPLGAYAQGSVEMTLKMLAAARIIMPLVLLPATTSLATLHPKGRELSLSVGANVIMPNVSPQEFRAYYAIYPNKASSVHSISETRQKLIAMIEAEGRIVAKDFGHSPKKQFQQLI